MANIAYTCKYVLPYDVKKVEIENLRAQQQKIASLREKQQGLTANFESLLQEVIITQISLACAAQEIDQAYKQLAADYRRYKNPSNLQDSHEREEDIDDDVLVDEEIVWLHIADCVQGKTRKTKRDILTPEEACKAGKASKRHKLGHKKAAKDDTKTQSAKKQSVHDARKKRGQKYDV